MGKLPILAITCGDPAGNGPELAFRLATVLVQKQQAIPLLFGSELLLADPYLNAYLPHVEKCTALQTGSLQPGKVYFVDCYPLKRLMTKQPTADNGRAAHAYIVEAVKAIQLGHAQALITAPLCKESFVLAAIPFTGHTTLLQSLTQAAAVSMAFYTPSFSVLLATIHVPLADVSAHITAERLQEKIEHAYIYCRYQGIERPRIALAGLNPHAGENGLFGLEETNVIAPVIASYQDSKRFELMGPLSGDTVFYQAAQGAFDCVIAMYHDQGLGPVKLMHFHEAVNVTIGLPFLRFSPDHGTAFDRAYQQPSALDSMAAAASLACQWVT